MNKFFGIQDRNARFVEENQLLLGEYWKLFVKQFKGTPDDHDDGWRCEYFGKMMRGASITYKYTQNEELYHLLTETAEDMLTAQDGLGRFSTYSIENEFNGWDMWGRKYVLLGFLHYCEICRDPSLEARITEALIKHLDYITEHIGKGKKEIGNTSEHWKSVNSASILEPTLIMYRKTGKKNYLEFAEYLIDYLENGEAGIFKCAYEDKLDPFEYPVNKAYEVMSCFEGLLEYYEITGDEKSLKTVLNFAKRLKNSDITLIGSAGCFYEQFDNSALTQTDSDIKCIMQETCVTVTWMKLCHRLLKVTGDVRYADEIERSAYNALYGAVNTLKRKNAKGESFVFDSYSPLLLSRRSREVGGYKNIAENKYYGCCVAIGAHGTGMVPLYAARADENKLIIDFYESGTVDDGGFLLELQTAYPLGGEVKVSVKSAPEKAARLSFRIPEFTVGKASAEINGSVSEINGRYLEAERVWHCNDVITLHFDMSPRLVKPLGRPGKPASKNYVAVEYGPLVLARDARIGAVGTLVGSSDTLTVTPCDKGDFPCEFMADVTIGDNSFKMIDYMSAGKTWDEQSLTEAWLPTVSEEA